MNTSATIMLIISTVLLWGGLILATVHLIKHPDEDE
ncbi:methionine/alanine import family NSS transporter small subunit [Acinetobacter portensis]|uniref:Methionine/alanine import family NSS transporter small subunit n=2 Tax=Acinetobacter TaxID=469 RepID=A0A6L6GIA4_9GAMM|nr:MULTISPECIES: methionine/alanine import family NSS transporter small subunit [Acinetobacter]MBP8063991.1 methionine/alanine import family NSS transporter small subunit [Acinetobacter sp.]MCK7610198.1 methionine/alanine import family NSS transporter small subunit [Acinetobacter portensis]MCK7640973.1 methionine/alanine import family NSS transporter small subunit [Acinetobacter portensis]MDY6460395.1 methionine/alanine import family NSS transporter small subunit [Acinetobacter faecalis]MDY646